MTAVSYPGVYVEEIERGPKPIEGVSTSTTAFLGEAENISFINVLRVYALGLGDKAHGLDTVAEPRRLFKIQGFRGGLHGRGKLCFHCLAFAIQKTLSLPHQLIIGRHLDIAHTWRRTTLDLVEQTGPSAIGINTVITGS